MDRDVRYLINQSCGDLRKGMDKNDESIPYVLNKIVGKKLLFRVHVAQFNLDYNYFVYTVAGLTDDSETIENFKIKFQVNQDMSNEVDETLNDSTPPMDTIFKDAFSVTGSNVDGTTSTANSPNAKRLWVTNGTDPKSVNKSRSVIKSKNLKDKCAKLDM